MFDKYNCIELEKDEKFLDLGSFFGKFVGSFFYYQQKPIFTGDDQFFYVYVFHLNKSDCTEKDENDKPLPILMCYIGENGIALPVEIIKDIRSNDNKIYLYYSGYGDFILSTKVLELKGLTFDDDEINISFFNTECEEGE